MMSELSLLPIRETLQPRDQDELQQMVRSCSQSRTPMYPVGGGTSLDFGLLPTAAGVAVSLRQLNRIIDYPARDMTVTVEAGVTMRQLADVLRQENQCWPIDVPRADEATLGGVVATNFNGPRRYGCGTVRDHVIGIHAVNSLGEPFKGGGRVVKNVAGYDFCKLLTGSLGTLGILTQFTLRLVPLPPKRRIIACQPRDWEHAEQLLESLVHMKSNPAAIEMLAGAGWSARSELVHDASSPTLVVVWEGTSDEVDWLTAACQQRWLQQDVRRVHNMDEGPTERCWRELVEFPARGKSPLVLKATMLPSVVTRFMQQVQQLDPQCSQQAHAGSGIVYLRFSSVPDEGIARTLFGRLRPATQGGQVIVLANPGGDEMTPACVWGPVDASHDLMKAIKREFDPLCLLNPGRFAYG